MPRKSQQEAVAERTAERLEEQRRRRSEAATKAAQTRRERRAAATPPGEAEPAPQAQPAPDRGKRGGARPRKDPEAVTIAFKGAVALKLRELASQGEMSLAEVVQEAVLVLEARIAAGYAVGTTLREHRQAATPQD